MTMTETPPVIAAATAAPEAPARRVGLYGWVTTSNHATLGRLWLLAAVPLLLAVLALSLLLGIERADAASVDIFGGANDYFRFWSLHRMGLPLLVVAPLFVGLATLIVPPQVGATNIAFPRAALAAFWGWLLGGVIMVIAAIAGGGYGAIDGVTGDEADAIALTLVGTGLAIVSLLLAAICIATTVVSLRTPGMSLLRVPLFAWSMLVASAVWLLTLPVAITNLTLAYLDLRGTGPLVFGNPEPSDQSIAIWSQVEWVTGQPQVYAFAIPVLGVIGSIVPVAAGVRHARHWLMVALIAMFGFLSVGGWSQPAFYDATEDFTFVAFGLVAVVPVLIALGGAMATLVAGGDRFAGLPSTALLGSLSAILILFAATASGAVRVIEPFELGGTSTIGGVFELTMFAAVLAAVAGIWFWAPKLSGSTLSEGLGRFAVLSFLTGAVLVGIAQVVAGFFEADELQLVTPADDTVEALNALVLIGTLLIVAGAAVVLAAVVRSVLPGAPAADRDPWDGHTLEWATESPPRRGNFSEPPASVTSEAPLLDQRGNDGEDA